MSLRALLIRLEKLEATNPAPVESDWQPSSTLAQDLADVIESSKRFVRLSPREKVIELRAELRQERHRNTSPVAGLSAKLDKIHLCFRDITEEHLRDAEIAYLAELGHPEARHPLTPEYREILDLELFDA